MTNSAVLLLENTKHPDKTALIYEDESITFAQWRETSRSIGTYLLYRYPAQTPAKRPVIVYMPRQISALISFFGVLYSGNIYAPIDYATPLARFAVIIENLNPLCIITDEQGKEVLTEAGIAAANDVLLYGDLYNTVPDAAHLQNVISGVIDVDPVYIMHTSGSTGVPKGVTIPHRGVIDYSEWVVETFSFDVNTVLGAQSAFYFDNSVLDIYGCLRSGASMVIIPDKLFLFPGKLPGYVNQMGINTIFWVPTVMINTANSGALEQYHMPLLKKVLFCGEAMPNAQLNVWRRTHPGAIYANLYGPTEITDVCTYYIVDREFGDSEPLPIGRPCRNMDVVILNGEDRQVSPGEIGELCVLGTGLALGYWNAKEQTETAFTQNPLNRNYRELMYRTGDLAVYAEDGLIMCLGRKDSQIKLKGNRIELGDIETAAKSLHGEGVENACAMLDRDAQEIVLIVQCGRDLKLRQLNLRLKQLIPAYMLPGRLVVMSELPLTSNGKIDRVRLREELGVRS